jgi:hypothetical protein
MEWINTCDKFIAYFDIMGFKDFLFRNPHDTVLKKMESLNTVLNPIYNAFEKRLQGEEEDPMFHSLIRPLVFSDSIIFISNSNTENDLNTLLLNCLWFIEKCIIVNIPVKGSISLGLFTADIEQSLYFGRPLIDAFYLQESIKFYGCIVDNTVEQFVKVTNSEYFNDALVQYKTPFAKCRVNHLNLNWITFRKNTETPDKFKKEVSSGLLNFYNSVHGETRIYVDNTIEFYEFCNKRKI